MRVSSQWVHEHLSRWLEGGCRYFICLLMLVYGLVKIFTANSTPTRCGRIRPSERSAGCSWSGPFTVTRRSTRRSWGAIEVFVGLLILLFKRTIGLGIVLFLPVIANLVLINIIYQVGALGSAVPLLHCGLILLSLHFQA